MQVREIGTILNWPQDKDLASKWIWEGGPTNRNEDREKVKWGGAAEMFPNVQN